MVYKVDYEKSDKGIYIMELDHLYSDGSKSDNDLFCIRINSPKPGDTDIEYSIKKLSPTFEIIGVDLV